MLWFTVPYVVPGLCAKPAKYSWMKSSLKCLRGYLASREFLDETEIVKCGRDVEEFRVEAKLSFTALLGREQVDADRVIEEQIRGMLTQEISGLFRKQGIGNEQGRG
jgi:hypothetical protein